MNGVGPHAGLGDIAVPGLLACLALRFDSSKLTLSRSKAAAPDAEEPTVNRASEEILQQRPYFVTTMVSSQKHPLMQRGSLGYLHSAFQGRDPCLSQVSQLLHESLLWLQRHCLNICFISSQITPDGAWNSQPS